MTVRTKRRGPGLELVRVCSCGAELDYDKGPEVCAHCDGAFEGVPIGQAYFPAITDESDEHDHVELRTLAPHNFLADKLVCWYPRGLLLHGLRIYGRPVLELGQAPNIPLLGPITILSFPIVAVGEGSELKLHLELAGWDTGDKARFGVAGRPVDRHQPSTRLRHPFTGDY